MATKKTVYKVMTEDELLKEAEKLSKSNDSNVRNFGIALKDAILNKFVRLTDLFQRINVLLFVGGPALAATIGIIMAVLLLLVGLVPLATISVLLHGQKTLLKSMIRKPDENVERYFVLVDHIDKGRVSIKGKHVSVRNPIVVESSLIYDESIGKFTVVTEAPNEITPDDTTTDYTAEAEEDTDNEDDTEANEEEGPGDDEPIDYTQDEEIGDQNADAEPEDNPGDATADDNVDTGEGTPEEDTEDTQEDEPMDYTQDAELTGEGTDDEGGADNADTGEADPEATDTDTDTTDEMGENTEEEDPDEQERKNSIVKNYNLMIDLKKLYLTTSDILNNLSDVIYDNPIQNQVLERCVDNLQTLMDQVLNYVEFSFSTKYEDNLYYYNVFLQALKLNLEILKKNRDLEDSDKNS